MRSRDWIGLCRDLVFKQLYQNDSFYSLSTFGQLGLVFLSLLLCLGLMWVLCRLSRGRSVMVSVLLSLVLFYLFVWLSPQIYYSYYWLIMENLPVQNVIKRPPSFYKIADFMFFQGRATYSNHAKGLMNLAMISLAVWSSTRRVSGKRTT